MYIEVFERRTGLGYIYVDKQLRVISNNCNVT